MTTGVFITLEGGEGSGKSTLSRHLRDYLTDKGVSVLLTREPGGTVEAEAIRQLVVEGSKDRFDPITEALLFNAARRHHLTHAIIPALQQGQWVICDRFIDSTLVYQGYVQGVDQGFLKTLHQEACMDVMPHVTFLLDVPVEVGLFRASKRTHAVQEDRFEQKGYAFHTNVRNAFLELARRDSGRFHILDSTQAEDQLLASAVACLRSLL